MKKKLLGIVAASAFALAAVGAPVAADQGGVPNENACAGEVTAIFAQDNGLHQGQAGYEKPGQVKKAIIELLFC